MHSRIHKDTIVGAVSPGICVEDMVLDEAASEYNCPSFFGVQGNSVDLFNILD